MDWALKLSRETDWPGRHTSVYWMQEEMSYVSKSLTLFRLLTVKKWIGFWQLSFIWGYDNLDCSKQKLLSKWTFRVLYEKHEVPLCQQWKNHPELQFLGSAFEGSYIQQIESEMSFFRYRRQVRIPGNNFPKELCTIIGRM